MRPRRREETLGTYDQNHKIVAIEIAGRLQIKFEKNGRLLEHDDHNMINDFLRVYELTLEDTSLDELVAKVNEFNRKFGVIVVPFSQQQGLRYIERRKAEYCERIIPQQVAMQDFDELVGRCFENIGNPEVLPVLTATRKLLQQPEYCQLYDECLNDTLCVIVQHGFATIVHLMHAILALGVNPSNIILLTKPHTTTAETQDKFKFLADRLGIHYIETELGEDNYHEKLDTAFVKVVCQMDRCLCENEYYGLSVCDEGGRFVDSDYFKNWKNSHKDLQYVRVEHTSSGMQDWDLAEANISLAGSWIKTRVESYIIAESILLRAEDEIGRLIGRYGQPIIIGVIGCGNIGNQIVEQLKVKYGDTIQVISSDMKEENAQVFRDASLVFGCTGVDVSEGIDLEDSTTQETILCSASSGEREFKSLLIEIWRHEGGDYVKQYSHGLEIRIKNKGMPLNFSGDKHAVHPCKIQLTRAAKLGAWCQSLMHLRTRKLRACSILPENQEEINHKQHLVSFNPDLQQFIFQALQRFNKRATEVYGEDLDPALSAALLPDELFQLDFNPESIRVDSEGLQDIQLDQSAPDSLNFLLRFDENHEAHFVVDEDGNRGLVFVKDGLVVVDATMIQSILDTLGLSHNDVQSFTAYNQMFFRGRQGTTDSTGLARQTRCSTT